MRMGAITKKVLLLRKTSAKELYLRSNKERCEGVGTKKTKAAENPPLGSALFFYKKTFGRGKKS